jgi:hypothetical protein
MKSAEEWHEVAAKIGDVLNKPNSGIINPEFVHKQQALKYIKAIQFDAMLTMAELIITAANALTEKDL